MLVPYLTRLWRLEHYQFFPFVFLTVAALILSRWDGQPRALRGWLNWGFILGGWVCTGISIAIFSPWMGAVGFVSLAAACLGSMREPNGSTLAVLALPLLTLIRLPLQTDTLLIIRLQGSTTKLASLLLDGLSIPHLMTGNVIELASRELFVAEACSGIQSVFTLFFAASLLIAYNRHPLWFVPLYWLAAVLLAVLGNSIRVAGVAAGEWMLGADWASGLSHDLLGYTTLSIAVVLLLSFDQAFSAVLHPLRGAPNYLGLQSNPLVDLWNRCIAGGSAEQPEDGALVEKSPSTAQPATTNDGWALPVALTPCVLLLLTLTSLSVVHGWIVPRQLPAEEDLTISFVPPEDMLEGIWEDDSILGHEIAREGEDRRLGKAADIWTVQDRQLSYQVVLSQPYIGWHELCICYENMDWQLADRSVFTSARAHAEDRSEWGSPDYAFARFRRDDGRRGYLLFSAITYEGRGAQPPLGPRLTERLGQRIAVNAYAPRQELMMLQLWMESPARLHPDEIQRLKDAFERARSRVIETVRSSPEAVVSADPKP